MSIRHMYYLNSVAIQGQYKQRCAHWIQVSTLMCEPWVIANSSLCMAAGTTNCDTSKIIDHLGKSVFVRSHGRCKGIVGCWTCSLAMQPFKITEDSYWKTRTTAAACCNCCHLWLLTGSQFLWLMFSSSCTKSEVPTSINNNKSILYLMSIAKEVVAHSS